VHPGVRYQRSSIEATKDLWFEQAHLEQVVKREDVLESICMSELCPVSTHLVKKNDLKPEYQ
jgi:hypothetical protein